MTSLYQAAYDGKTDTVAVLLAHGANPAARTDWVSFHRGSEISIALVPMSESCLY